MNTASKGSATCWSSWMWSARTGRTWSPQVPERRSPRARMVSTCSGHWSTKVTSLPARASSPPTTHPIAPAPMIPIRMEPPFAEPALGYHVRAHREGAAMLSAVEFIQLGLTRLHKSLDKSLADLTPEQLHAVPAGHAKANTIAFGLWHYARTEDNV